MDDKKGQGLETNMHAKAWWVFAFASLFAYFRRDRMVEEVIRKSAHGRLHYGVDLLRLVMIDSPSPCDIGIMIFVSPIFA